MIVLKILASEAGTLFKRVWPALLVMLVVMLLLRGVSGTFEAIQIQLAAAFTCVFGHADGDDVAGVIAHTLPLAFSAALVTFVLARRWLTVDSWMSVVILSGIILGGTSIGGLLKSVLPEPKVPESGVTGSEVAASEVTGSEVAASEVAGTKTTTVASVSNPNNFVAESSQQGAAITPMTGGVPKLIGQFGFSEAENFSSTIAPESLSTNIVLDRPIYKPGSGPLQRIQKKSAWQQLSEIDWFAVPDLKTVRQREIEPLEIVPKFSGIAALISGTINQVLGFLVAYQPRLFLAAIIAGSWLGWTWHRKLEEFQKKIDDDAIDQSNAELSNLKPASTLRSAA